MPAIKEDNGVCSGYDFGCDLVEMELHGFAVAGRQHEGGADSAFGADRTKQIGRLGPLIMSSARASTFPGPAIGELVLLPHPHLVLEPDHYLGAWCKRRAGIPPYHHHLLPSA